MQAKGARVRVKDTKWTQDLNQPHPTHLLGLVDHSVASAVEDFEFRGFRL